LGSTLQLSKTQLIVEGLYYMSDKAKIWKKAASNIVKAGVIPFPITDTLFKFLQLKLTEEQAKFLRHFRKPSMNLDQLKEKTGLPEAELLKMLESLMAEGIVSGTISRSRGIKVYSLMPLFPGMIEFTLMKGEYGETQKKLAALIEEIFAELREGTQRNYDDIMPQFKNYPPPARVIPVEEKVEVGQEQVLLTQEASKLIDAQTEPIGLTTCYCKHEKELIGDPCKVSPDNKEICLLFGKAAYNAINYDYAREISKDEAKKILKYAEDIGLVHKIFHKKLDFNSEIEGICSCCACCCGIFRLFHEGVWPFHTITNYLAKVNPEECVGCETCVEKCQIHAISMENDTAKIDEARCIGCGVCAHLCPQGAIELQFTEQREIFIPPPRV
jgi:ferredoxin/DNA-binding HxlR family transcriptional regulator